MSTEGVQLDAFAYPPQPPAWVPPLEARRPRARQWVTLVLAVLLLVGVALLLLWGTSASAAGGCGGG